MPKLSREEQETIICFNESSKTAYVFTHNRKMTKYLTEKCNDSESNCTLLETNANGGVTFEVPKKWVKVRSPRKVSDEQRARMAKLAKERFGE